MCSEGPQTAVGGGWGVPRGGTWGPPGEAVSGEAGCRAAAIGSCMWGDSRGPRAAGRGPRKGRGPALLCPTRCAALGSSLRLCEPRLQNSGELMAALGISGDFRRLHSNPWSRWKAHSRCSGRTAAAALNNKGEWKWFDGRGGTGGARGQIDIPSKSPANRCHTAPAASRPSER